MRILMIGPIEKTGGVSTHTKALVEELRKLGCSVEVYNTSPNRNYPRRISNIVKVYKKTLEVMFKLLRDKKKFDIIHVQASGPIGGFLPALSASVFKWISDFKLIITFHYSGYVNFIKKHKRLFKFVLTCSNSFVVVSNGQRVAILENIKDIDDKRVVVIPNGFTPERFPIMLKEVAREKLGLPMDKKIVFNISNLYKHKGQDILIKAMKRVIQKRNDILCFIGGKGPMKHELEELITKLGLEDYVQLVGFIPDDQLTFWMNAADLFVLPSLSESFGVVQIEAMACGVPVVATRNGGSEEIIISEDYGLLCEPGDPGDLAEKILIALEKEWDREKIKKYVERFTWENVAKETLRVYREVLRGDKS